MNADIMPDNALRLVDQRSRGRLLYVNRQQYALFLLIESHYVNNLSLKTLAAHTSDLFVRLKNLVTESMDIKQAFARTSALTMVPGSGDVLGQ